MINFFDRSMNQKQLIGFLVGAIIIAALGVWDDMKNLPAKLKFCVQIVAALIVIFSGTKIEIVLWPVTTTLQALSIPITLIWIVGVTNAVNLIELDGALYFYRYHNRSGIDRSFGRGLFGIFAS